MKNETTIKVPKKYKHMIKVIYKDDEGYWAYSNDGYKFEGMGCHTAHEATQKELLAMIRTLTECTCCSEEETTIEEDEGEEMGLEIDFLITELEEELYEIKDIEGRREGNRMFQDLQNLNLIGDFSIIYNDRMRLAFTEDLEIRFETTYSNRKITPDFINEMLLIDQKKDRIGGLLKSLYIEMKRNK